MKDFSLFSVLFFRNSDSKFRFKLTFSFIFLCFLSFFLENVFFTVWLLNLSFRIFISSSSSCIKLNFLSLLSSKIFTVFFLIGSTVYFLSWDFIISFSEMSNSELLIEQSLDFLSWFFSFSLFKSKTGIIFSSKFLSIDFLLSKFSSFSFFNVIFSFKLGFSFENSPEIFSKIVSFFK